jgi:phosphoglycolate phosphatase-like HAD superfamily hydrolase
MFMLNSGTKVIVVDFDGVVVRNSEQYKTDAWRTIAEKYGEQGVRALEEAEKRYGRGKGGDRFTILKAMFEVLNVSAADIEGRVHQEALHFDDMVQARILKEGADPEVIEALEVFADNRPIYLNSATPIEALKKTIANLNIGDIFVDVLGRPRSKIENFGQVADREGIKPSEILFVGDSLSDAHAAETFGCQFVGYRNPLSNDWGEMPKFSTIPAMHMLANFL